MSSLEYNEDYFEKGEELGISGYTDYKWMPTRTLETANEIIRRSKIGVNDMILDYGCAKGFLVKAFKWLGYNAKGYDISDYAITHCDEEIKNQIYNKNIVFGENQFDFVICKDVVEHIEKEELYEFLRRIYTICQKAIFIIPLGNGRKYNIPKFENDTTHKIRQPIGWWLRKLEEVGFEVVQVSDDMNKIKPNWNSPMANIYVEVKKW